MDSQWASILHSRILQNPLCFVSRRSMRHATTQGSIQGLVQYWCITSKLPTLNWFNRPKKYVLVGTQKRCIHKLQVATWTFPQWGTEPYSAESTLIIRLSDRPSVILNATSHRGSRQSQSFEGFGGLEHAVGEGMGPFTMTPATPISYGLQLNGRTRPLSMESSVFVVYTLNYPCWMLNTVFFYP